MKCEDVQLSLPEYIDGKLDKETSASVRDHFEDCDACRKLYTELGSFLTFMDSVPEIDPPAGMKEEFLKMAEEVEIPVKRKTRILPLWSKVAAVIVVVLLSYWAGFHAGSDKSAGEKEQLAMELDRQKQEVLLASLRDYTGPQKIEAVYHIGNAAEAGDELIDALVYTMNTDKNINVRLAAINALSEMMNKNKKAKTELIRSLSVQDNSLLQISLIQVLTEGGVKEAREKIESLTESDKTDENVKAFAKDMIKIII